MVDASVIIFQSIGFWSEIKFLRELEIAQGVCLAWQRLGNCAHRNELLNGAKSPPEMVVSKAPSWNESSTASQFFASSLMITYQFTNFKLKSISFIVCWENLFWDLEMVQQIFGIIRKNYFLLQTFLTVCCSYMTVSTVAEQLCIGICCWPAISLFWQDIFTAETQPQSPSNGWVK